MTLDEYKALRGNRQKPIYNLRKAGEGEDPSQWKKMYALAKKKEGDEDDDDDEVLSNLADIWISLVISYTGQKEKCCL